MISARSFLAAASLAAAFCVSAQPARPVKLVLASAPGTTADAVARVLAPRLAEAFGQPVTVDNEPGAAAEIVAKSAPDGSTLFVATPALAALVALQPRLPYDGIKAFAPVARVATEPLVVVATATLPTSSLVELILLAKASPGRINYASAGPGSVSHLAAELFKSAATVQLAHSPAKTIEAGVAEVVAGRAKVAFAGMSAVDAALRAGKLRALAVTGPARLALLPDVPTMRESGLVDYDFSGWFGVLAPATTSKAMVDRLNADLRKVVQMPEVRARLAGMLGVEPQVSTPEEFATQLRRQVVTFDKLARELNLKLE